MSTAYPARPLAPTGYASSFCSTSSMSSSGSSAASSRASSVSSSSNHLMGATWTPVNEMVGSLVGRPEAHAHDMTARLSGASDPCLAMLDSVAASEDALAEWRAKYDRLFEAHRRLQKTNHTLEDKLLRIVDKFEADKNQMTRDLASQTQKLVQAKLTTQQLHDRNQDLQSDLNLALTLLQNRPSSYLAQRVDSLPSDMQARVRSYIADKQAEKLNKERVEGKKIRVPIMDDVGAQDVSQNDKVSAAILAKVLEERSKERKKERKFCIDVGTQTHGWHFPDKLYASALPSPPSPPKDHPHPSSENIRASTLHSVKPRSSPVIRTPPSSVHANSISSDLTPTRAKPAELARSLIDLDEDRYEPVANFEKSRRTTQRMKRSATFSATQTDL
ncbi:hypothetical protein TCAL_15385 [Tigriopus californicus]|uniref:Tight junction-associated protein 1 domain-containing protein n=1 Tax=Tigriopus californicus TaxID=6832 RepID=A0A553PJH7_TIGCA|nr:hypothetical protein TCAL_15385 [Tigriopus californicus]